MNQKGYYITGQMHMQDRPNRNTKGNKTVCKDAQKPNMPMDDVFG